MDMHKFGLTSKSYLDPQKKLCLRDCGGDDGSWFSCVTCWRNEQEDTSAINMDILQCIYLVSASNGTNNVM